MPNVRRRSGEMNHPMGGAIKNAVTQRKDSPTVPKDIRNQVRPASMAKVACVKNATC